jgi:hypothetical protein
MDERFESLLEWLLLGSVDFDLICEALLPGQCPAGGAPLRVGHMAYDGIVVPQCETLRATTLDRLEAFAAAGGRLIFAGGAPTHVDAVPSHRAQTLAARSHLVSYSRGAILEALAPCRHLTLREADGSLTNDLIHQLRQDGEGRWLFVSHAREPENKDCPRPREIDILLPGAWRPTLYDTMTGATRPLPAALVRGETGIRHTLWDFDSLLLWLEPATAPLQPEPAPVAPPAPVEEALPVPGWVPVTLSEPNALLLDTARWRLDDGAWQPEEEILRLDDACRALLGWPLRGQALAQPWVVPPEPPAHTVTLEFDIVSEIEVAGAKLALENAARALVVLNGRAVPSLPGGWFVDEDIHTLSLPNFGPGSSVLRLTLPFDKRTGLEWCYILGGFGVRVAGSRAVVTQAPGGLGFGDITGQGLPFYVGNITYHIPFESPGGRLAVQASHYRGALWKADLDGQSSARVALPPYVFEAEAPPGAHVLSLTVFGHRYNAFGAVHNSNTRHLWHGPDAWRTKGCAWSASYQLKPLGLLSAPVLTLHR